MQVLIHALPAVDCVSGISGVVLVTLLSPNRWKTDDLADVLRAVVLTTDELLCGITFLFKSVTSSSSMQSSCSVVSVCTVTFIFLGGEGFVI